MDNSVDDLQQESWSVTLETILRSWEKNFFQGIPPVSGLRIVAEAADYPARYEPNDDNIELNAAVARFPKLATLLIVHELVHHKLYIKDPSHASEPYGPEYLKEIRELCKHDPYLNLR